MQRSKLIVLGIFVALVATSLTLLAQKRSVLDIDPPVRGIHWARGHQPAQAGGNPDLIWHGGNIMVTAQTAAIFWGSNWSNSNFASDKITGLDSWYAGVGGSKYGATVDEFTGPQGTQVKDSISYLGHYVDTTPGPSRAPKTSTILAEVCKVIPASQLASNGYYAVYIDAPRAHAGYCAWHSAGSCGGVPIQFAFFFNLDGDPGCDPQSTISSQSQGLAALANVTGHELSEAAMIHVSTPGTIPAARKTRTSVRGPSAARPLPSRTALIGRYKATGQIMPMTITQAIPTAAVRMDA